MPVQLNSQASAALKEIIRQNAGQLPASVETELKKLEQSTPATDVAAVKQISLEQLEKLLTDAMPDQKQRVKDACQHGAHHCDGRNAQFLTQILSTRVVKIAEVQAGYQQPIRRSDPYYAEFNLDPRAQSMLLFNARDVDRNGQPLLMKVVMRMSKTVEAAMAMGQKEIDAAANPILTFARSQYGAAVTIDDVYAAAGLRSSGADGNVVQWLQQTQPAQLQELKKKSDLVQEIKTKFVDEQLPKLDLTRYRREPADAKPDVELVGARATVVSTQDFDEGEFQFGDRLKQVSISGSGRELSTSLSTRPENDQFNRAWTDPTNTRGRRADYDRHTTGDNLDTAAVKTFDDRIRVTLGVSDAPGMTPGAWLDESIPTAAIKASLSVERGLVFEPGAHVDVGLGNALINVAVDEDPEMLGNAPSSTDVKLAENSTTTLRSFLNQQLTRTSWAQKDRTDANVTQQPLVNAVYANAASVGVGAGKLAPLSDVTFKQAELEANKLGFEACPVTDPQSDAVRIHFKVGEGFLTAEAGKASVEGWKMQVGYYDDKNQWVAVDTRKVKKGAASQAETFTFDVDGLDKLTRGKDAQGNPTSFLEMRLYNADGVPAERIKVPFREVVWEEGAGG